MHSDRSGNTARKSSQTSRLKACRSEGVPSANVNEGEGGPHEGTMANASPTARRRRRPDVAFVNLWEVDTFSTDSIDKVRQ